MRRAFLMIGATLAVIIVPLVIVLVARHPSESDDCGDDGWCSFTGMDEAVEVVTGRQGDDGLEENGWRAAILARIGDPSDLLTCEHDVATVTVLSWVVVGETMEVDTYIVGWSDESMSCAERRRVRLDDIPATALSGLPLPGGTVTVSLPSSGDTFLVEPAG